MSKYREKAGFETALQFQAGKSREDMSVQLLARMKGASALAQIRRFAGPIIGWDV